MLDALFVLATATLLALTSTAVLRGLPQWHGQRLLQRPLVIWALALACAVYGSFRLSRARGVQLMGELVTRVKTRQHVVALTFDDGPTAEFTEAVIATLRAYRARATFFVVGQEGEAAQGALAALVGAGHEIGNHSFTHQRWLATSQQRIDAEVIRTDQVIRKAGFTGTIYVRPPYCKRLLDAPFYLWRTNRTTVTWDVEPDSIPEIADNPAAMVAHVRDHVRPGSIVLMHVMHAAGAASRAALPGILHALVAQRFRFVTVSELISLGAAESGDFNRH